MEKLQDTLAGKIHGLSGFKISNAHFRIGSKMHISEFYYAKRFFQNSFYATRIAYLLSVEIMKKHGHLADKFSKDGLSLIGYGQYSELLLSLTEKFLSTKMRLKGGSINHNLFDDSESMELIKKEKPLAYVIILVPIATTFSTSVKMEEKLMNEKTRPEILYPHFNIIHIYHKPGFESDDIHPMEELFGWTSKKIADKAVFVQSTFDQRNPEKEQQYFISLPSTWHNVKDCEHCFPTMHDKEKPLFDTDKTQTTPTLIFDFPVARKLQPYEYERKVILTPKLFRYGHHKRKSNHFHFYIDASDFFTVNRPRVKTWLWQVKKSEAFKGIYKGSDQVVLLAGGHHSNAAFVNLVNTVLFSSAATIIHYDPSEDFAQNFKMIYREELIRANRIYYVDDALHTGRAFHRIFHFVQFVFEELNIKAPGSRKGIDGCFYLINCANDYDYKKVTWKMISPELIFSYGNFHLPTASNSDGVSPLYAEQQRYLAIEKDTFLDSLKIYFWRQASKLEPTTDSVNDSNNHKENNEQHLLMLIATHCIYEYFRHFSARFEQHPNLRAFVADVIAEVNVPLQYRNLQLSVGKEPEMSPTELAFLKVLSQYPFIQYKPLRDKCFDWTIYLLNHKSFELATTAIKEKLLYRQFKEFKFLIRRAGLLNSNYLITSFFFNVLEKVLDDEVLSRMIVRTVLKTGATGKAPEDSLESMRENTADFHVFLAAQIKELLFRNETRGVKLLEVMNSLQPTRNERFNQFIRMLKEELVVMVRKFEQFIAKREGWEIPVEVVTDEEPAQTVSYNNSAIIGILEDKSIKSTYRYSNIYTYLGEKDLAENTRLINYLWILRFLDLDNKTASLAHSVFERTAILIDKIKDIITTAECGAFLLLNGVSANVFVAYNKGADYARGLDLALFNQSKKVNAGLIDQFNRGIGPYLDVAALSILELHYDGQEWKNSDTGHGVEMVPGSMVFDLPGESDTLILMRLTKPGPGPETMTIQGTFGFFFKKTEQDLPNDISDRQRYLLLLRKPLVDFFGRHHENNEFRELHYSMLKEKTALLTGHGREMLIAISVNGDARYRDIVTTLLLIQRLIIDKKEAFEEIGLSGKKIDQIFKTYYKANKEILQQKFFEDLKWLAQDVFIQDEIENKIDVFVHDSINQQAVSFHFSAQLLLLICFELLVNAKKNRWIFLPGEQFTDTDSGVYTINHVWIAANIDGNVLVVNIANTGPAVDKDTFAAMNLRKNVKVYDKTSGIELIDTMLDMFELGTMQYSYKEVDGQFGITNCELRLQTNIPEDAI